MTDPQLPPPAPYNPAPPIPPAPGGHAVQPPYPQPVYQSPPGAYTAPVGGYSAPAGAYQPPQPASPKSPVLGVIAFIASLVAAVVMPILAGVAAYQIGFQLPAIMSEVDTAASDLSILSPVRDQVLMGEIGFWIGTLLGIVAIVVGIVAIARRQGRAWGIVALIIGVLGPVIFFTVISITVTAGAGAGGIAQYS